jgi:tRNA(Arg) A34 adenosine deaminase TadA
MMAGPMSPESPMRRAIALSRERMQAGDGGPFGAVIVRDGAIVAEGWNQVVSANDSTAHAEIMAIRRACAALGRFELSDCEIYTSCEPCPMCLAAIYWARLARICYAADRTDAAASGFDDALLYQEIALPIEERRIPTTRMLAEEAREAFAEWGRKADKVPY